MSTFIFVSSLHQIFHVFSPGPPFAVVSLVTTWWATVCSLVVFSRRVHGNTTLWVLACLKKKKKKVVWNFYTWEIAWQHIKSLAYTSFLKYPMRIVPLFWHWKLLGLAWFCSLMSNLICLGGLSAQRIFSLSLKFNNFIKRVLKFSVLGQLSLAHIVPFM